MKAKYIIAFICSSAILVSACKKEVREKPVLEQREQSNALGINIALKGVTKTPITGETFSNTSKINVILLDAAATAKYNVMAEYKFDRQDPDQPGSWIPTVGEGLMVKAEEALVLAHYPASDALVLSADKQTITPSTPDILDIGENNNSSLYESFQISLDPAKPTELTEVFSAKADIDHMTGVGTNVSVTPPGVKNTTITMKHAKAMVIVHLTKAANFTGDDNLKKITFRNNVGKTTLQKGSFKISDNSFTPVSPTTYERTMDAFPIGTYFSMLVNPVTIAADEVQMRLVVGSITYILKVPAQQWESGKVYLYNVNMVGNDVVLDNQVLIYDWPTMVEHKVELE